MFDPTELKGLALVVGAIVGLLSVLAPLFVLFKRAAILKFPHPGVFALLAEMGSLLAFLFVLDQRMELHRRWPFWVWLSLTLVLIGVLIFLHNIQDRQQQGDGKDASWITPVGAITYAAAATLFSLGLTQFAAESMMFYRIHGTVTSAAGKPWSGLSVFLIGAGEGRNQMTRTNRVGYYRFLLTGSEAAGTNQLLFEKPVQIRSPLNYVVVSYDTGASSSYRRDLVYR